ncbi:glycosyltransferase 87 family protein [Acidipropionibacterium thoenii]|uniref:glycosyltransferase 87 family protein n=1 Tax=Acidipropionibacterium thoenii TaxID=1751 RepID=UPI00041A3ED8|nr:glycosyltransferase 87 family protein [Acidipropionibacterium thoenii]
MPDPQQSKTFNRARAEFLTGAGVTALWVLTRLLMLRIFTLPNASYITGDVGYYHYWLTAAHIPVQEMLREYPVPVIWGMRTLLWASGGSDANYFLVLFVVAMIVLDAIMTLALWRYGHRVGALWWILFVMAIGPLMWFRFDMVPAVSMGLAALWFRRHPSACGAAVAVGAAIKLWPALLILPMIGRTRAAVRRAVAFAISGAALALCSLAAAGITRSLSPLTWQSDRGLQIESIPATVPMLQRAISAPDQYLVALSTFNAYEISGPGVSEWLNLSSVAMVLAVAAAALIGWIAWARGGLSHRQAVLGAAVIIGALIVANKTLSPQYFIWWGAPVAVLLDRSGDEADWPRRRLDRVGRICLGIAGALFATGLLTQCVYPLSYSHIISPIPAGWATGLLVVRNLMAVVTLGICVWGLVVSLRTSSAPAADRARGISPLEKTV